MKEPQKITVKAIESMAWMAKNKGSNILGLWCDRMTKGAYDASEELKSIMQGKVTEGVEKVAEKLKENGVEVI